MEEVVASAAAEGRAPGTNGVFSANAAAGLSYAVLGVVLLSWVVLLWRGWQGRLWFDDAFMFYRYAVNMRHGLGMSWNLDGVHTYGETAPLWGLAVYALTYLPVNASRALELGSWISSLAAFAGMAWAVSANASHSWMSSACRVAGLIVLPLAVFQNYWATALTGMETMLGMALCAVFVGAALRWGNGSGRAETAGVVGLLLFLTRPDAGLVVVLFPCMLVLVMRRGSVAGLAPLLGVFGAGVAANLVVCRVYFGTALPLSFYLKNAHGYEGYARYWHPTLAFSGFLVGVLPFLLLLAMLGGRADWRMLAAFGAPLLGMAVYLDRVLQIMNSYARYYLPYTPLIVVPALLVLDRRLSRGAGKKAAEVKERTRQAIGWSGSRVWRGALAVGLLTLGVRSWRVGAAVAIDRLTERTQYAYEPVDLETGNEEELPEIATVDLWRVVPSFLFKNLPAGATIASTEVGYVGASTPQANVIDLAGLNDTEIAIGGFRVVDLLARRPDAIWMPHPDYTWQRGVMLSDPEFLKQYEVIAGAAASGVAIRKDGRNRELLEANMRALWGELYPGIAMEGYVVKSASWTGRKHPLPDTGEWWGE